MDYATAKVPDKPRRESAKAPAAEKSPARKFFISYRRSERDSADLAQFLATRLETAGHEIFIDVGIPVGTDWVAEITARIDWCDYLIVLLSDAARTSEMVQGEVRMAHRRRKRDGKPGILPVRVKYEGTLDYELDSYLGRIQYLYWGKDADSGTVLDAIVERAGEVGAMVQPSIAQPAIPPIPVDSRRPQPRVDPRYVTAPGGSISYRDTFYIERPTDETVIRAAKAEVATTLVIKAPRQMGKSSLLIRYIAEAREQGREVCFLDFAEFSDSELTDYPRLLGALTDHLAQTFGTDPPATPPMQQRQLTKYFEKQILERKSGGLVLAFDEVDRLLGRPFQSDFFSLLRMWHNKRAELNGWERVSMALVISTEPYLLIRAEDRSPFNVSEQVVLEPFDLEVCRKWNHLYGDPLDAGEVEELQELLNGQPYLTRLAFYRLSTSNAMPFTTLVETAAEQDGPFGDHLRALLLKMNQQPDLQDALKRLIQNGTVPSQEVSDRLSGAGLIARHGGKMTPANLVYARFFKRVLR